MENTSVDITGKLCSLCRQFTTDLLRFDFKSQDSYPERWLPVGAYKVTGWFEERPWGDGFRHHETVQDLRESSHTCDVCYAFYSDLSQLDDNLCQGWLGLYPWWQGMRLGPNHRRGLFRAGFRQGLTKMPWGSSTITPLHTFKLCQRLSPTTGSLDLPEALPPTPQPSYIASRVEKWTQKCLENHEACQSRTKREKHELPTRVLDLDEPGSDKTVLYRSRGEVEEYVALSHCWGGKIPSITIKDNVEQRSTTGINTEGLPKNFRDAIEVTKALGVRYLWIDALCIIQDSPEDWSKEAGKMATVYAGAKIVISLLDAGSSTAGFLNPDRVPLAIVNDLYAVQKVFPQIYEYLEGCPLTTRGWCMQERLLAPTLLHIGKERMFWECLKNFVSEDGTEESGQSTGHVMGLFIALRARMGNSSEHQWKDWYTLIEEYTTRQFTFTIDKFPAIAGAAEFFQSGTKSATYVAGLWKEDIQRGLLWGAHYYHVPGRKLWGYSSADKCNELFEPPLQQKQRAPSWSWAALDGQIDHWSNRIGPGENWYEVLDVTVEGENELARQNVSGSIRIRGPVAHMSYNLPKPGGSVGFLTFVNEGKGEDQGAVEFNGCILDLDRMNPRTCWALIATGSNQNRYMLVLEEREDGSFKRIGFCTAYNVNYDPKRFSMREVLIT